MPPIFYLSQNPVLQFMVSFILVFGIVYSALGVTKISGNRNVNALVALAFALFATLNPSLSAFLWSVMPYAAIAIVVLFVVRVLADVFSINKSAGAQQNSSDFLSIAVLFFSLIMIGFFYSSGFFRMADPELVENLIWGVGIIIVLLIIIKGTGKGGKT